MDIKIVSVKDYFNYYFAGIVWFICAITIAFKNSTNYFCLIETFSEIPIALLVITVVVIPYILGFVLSPVGNFITILLRKLVGDPVNWVLVLQGNMYSMTKKPLQRRISEPLRTKILQKLFVLQGGYTKTSPFFYVRNYVEIKANDNTRNFVNRPLDIANLTESILLPIPVLGFLIGGIFLSPTFSFLLGAVLFLLLCYRYIQLRENWVKHNYRTFMILE